MNHDTLTLCFSFFLSFAFIHIVLSHSLSPCNGLTFHRWLCVGTSSEVLMGHMHDDQVNKQAGLGGGDRGSWSKVRITGKSQSFNAGSLVVLWNGYFRNLLWSASLPHCFFNGWQRTVCSWSFLFNLDIQYLQIWYIQLITSFLWATGGFLHTGTRAHTAFNTKLSLCLVDISQMY